MVGLQMCTVLCNQARCDKRKFLVKAFTKFDVKLDHTYIDMGGDLARCAAHAGMSRKYFSRSCALY